MKGDDEEEEEECAAPVGGRSPHEKKDLMLRFSVWYLVKYCHTFEKN